MSPPDLRLAALRRFAVAITVMTVAGQTLLGFEPAWAHHAAAIGTAYLMELLIETIDAWAMRRSPRYAGGPVKLLDFLLSPHISGCAVSMLLYSGSRLLPVVFAAAVAIGSKAIFRAPMANGAWRHFLNPSNFGITVTLLLFPSVGAAPTYQFTENFGHVGDWIVPGIVVITGSFLNTRFTRKMPLIAGWLGGFALQALVRTTLTGTSTIGALLPMTGAAFILFTFYMITDPATTPVTPLRQILFGASVAAVYGTIVAAHVVFGLFYALAAVTAGRGLYLIASGALRRSRAAQSIPAALIQPVPVERWETTP
jgi:hypothetical protein